MIYLKLAWRNIWRNKRRTLITVASVFFAVILSIIMRGLVEGVYSNMVKNIAAFSTGYIQVHKKGYWEEKNIDNSFAGDPGLFNKVNSVDNVKAIVPRIETFALASTGNNTAGVILLGIDPSKENQINELKQKVISGEYPNADDEAVMIGSGLAKKLKLSSGDTIVLLSQGFHAASANGMYPVKAILKLGSPELDKTVVYLPLKACQQLLSLDNQLTSLALFISSSYDMNNVKNGLKNIIDRDKYELMDWKEMMPELDQMIEADSGGNKIMLFVLYLVISFGIFSTILMMLAERRHEFGIMIAIGMKKHQLAWIVLIETLIISFIGVLLGSLVGWPMLDYFSRHPYQLQGEMKSIYESYGFEAIIPFSRDASVFINQAKVVLVIAIIVATYPVISIIRLSLMKALRS